LQYDLLCDPKATLIAAIGLKKSPSGTTRGVFVVDKEGKVLAAEPGSPAGTLEVVKKLLGLDGKAVELEKASSSDVVTQEKGNTAGNAEQKPLITEESKEEEDHNKAEIAAEVADTAEKIDSNTVVEA
jgi:peroxiredoxin Q/BCP